MVFSRRSIQRFINALSKTLPTEAVEELVEKLNHNDRASLSFEWETAIMFALGQFGKVDYECDHGGTRYADVTFSLSDPNIVSFVAEITTVSDRGLEEENPVSFLLNLLHEKAHTLGLTGGFQYRIEGDYPGKHYGDRKVQLAMPHKKQLRAYLDREIVPQLQRIKNSGVEIAEISAKKPYRMSIVYRNNVSGSSGSHPTFSVAYSLTRNPIYTSLKSKGRQLSEIGFGGCRGVFLCDGSCDLFRTEPNAGTPDYSMLEIIRDFLRQNRSIAFVAVIWVELPRRGVFEAPQKLRLCFKLIQNKFARYPLDEKVAKLLQEIPAFLPAPVNTATGGVRRTEAGKYGIGKTHYGGSTVRFGSKSTSVRLSSRAVLDLLAGTTDPLRFSEDHWPERSATSNRGSNPFAAAVAQGMTIQAASVEHREDEDDDWITFELSWPDVAVAPFQKT